MYGRQDIRPSPRFGNGLKAQSESCDSEPVPEARDRESSGVRRVVWLGVRQDIYLIQSVI